MAGMNAIATEQGKRSDPFKLHRGTAQGCPLSPTLFDVFIDDLVEKLHRNKKGINEVSVLAYADDILTLAASPEELQEQVNICAEWTANWRMKANAKKSQVMAWDVPACPKTELNITLNGTTLKQVECYEYLGIKIDTELKFKAHEIGKIHGSKAKLGAIKQLIKENYVPRKMKQQLVNSVVLQGPYYGLPFWGDGKTDALDKLIKEPCKVIAGVNNKYRANPYAAMAIAGIKPAEVQLLETATRQLGCIRNHNPDRLSKQTYQRDFRDDSLKARYDEFVGREEDFFEKECLRVQGEWKEKYQRQLPYTRVDGWNNPKEEESWGTRNALRCGCDSFTIHKKQLAEKFEVPHCPLCRKYVWHSQEGTPVHHMYLECKHTQNLRNELFPKLQRTDNNTFQNDPANQQECFKELLTPTNWSKESNRLINKWCDIIDNKFQAALTGKTQPHLNVLIDKSDHRFNDNVVGEVFIIGSGSYRLTGRVTKYNIVDNKHTLDTTGLDFDEQTLYWTTKEVDLGALMKNGQLQHLPKEEVVYLLNAPTETKFSDNPVRTIPMLLGNNLVNRTISLSHNGSSRKATVSDYNKGSGLHTVTYDDQSTAEVDLNHGVGAGTCSLPLSLTTAFDRLWRTEVFSQVPASAARSKPEGKADPR